MTGLAEVTESISDLIGNSTRQNWLFGAGISYDANIPLMYPLTIKVQADLHNKSQLIYDEIIKELKDEPCKPHIEHVLSQLGDLIAIATRSKKGNILVNSIQCTIIELTDLYDEIISSIVETVRFGYKDPSNKGDIKNPIIEIKYHTEFIKALFANRSNLESRSTINFFTTNYDTLLEDALAINKYCVIDGFEGAAIGFWHGEPSFSREIRELNFCKLYKLHGSVDWYNDKIHGLIRSRYGVKYFNDLKNMLIYPQATKYLETQKDPFASLFSGFRNELNHEHANLLITCGYSFGDNHINNEIEIALGKPHNKTTLVAFINEQNEFLKEILKLFPKRVYVITEAAVFNCAEEIKFETKSECWKFTGITKFLMERSF